ncbi:magnesium transporter CorA family protein [Streptococcus orisratti]|uniref:magnesium transporter CorA family protein n=1 Tax=Streptococcus TaxID=1301 RepID=UPI00036767D8|nr:magnesium transporter CorA family protein [Streptococcus orisratti]MCI7678203.1 magnesium transporter CorA family protein [Streptococcus orisratti]MDY4002823.1 magnesium transporter CorA family protein [Streptococcus orisratti]MDY5635681.1 magnesium transporter CorA family protein [Streptococcus orisratti]
MKQMFLSTALEFKEIETFEPGAWINLVNPSQEESIIISEQFNIDITDLRAPLDVEETSRITVEDDYTLIIVDVPTYEERNNKSYYVTIPLGIIVTENAVITTCLQELTLFDNFYKRRVRNFYTFMKTRFVFQLLYRNAELFLTALRTIDRQSDKIEAQLENATKNEQLIDMMELEKSIVYLKASLKLNERIVKKLSSSTSSLKKYIEDEDLLEDTLIETQQAIEMAGIYENVLNAMTETSAAIIGNNQNTIMKTLALMTMALDIPTVIFSAYGMNFKDNTMPFNGLPNAFWLIVLIAALGSSFVVIYFIRKKWF